MTYCLTRFTLFSVTGVHFLAVELYQEALVHFLGGAEKVIHPVDVLSDGVVLGKQKLRLLDTQTALHVSAASARLGTYRKHVERLLNHTPLCAAQWINFDKHTVTCTTI